MKPFWFASLAIAATLLAVCGANSLSLSIGESTQSQQQQQSATQLGGQQADSEKDSLVSAARNLGSVQAYQPSVGYQAPMQSYSSANISTPVYQLQQQQQNQVYQQATVYTAPTQQSYSNYSMPKVQNMHAAPLYVSKHMQQYSPVQSQQQRYLDTQPEFTQAWADYPQPPGYLPQAFRHANYVPGVGYGYVTWTGPINPQSFYTPLQLPYYYRFPPQSPQYNLAPPTYGPVKQGSYLPIRAGFHHGPSA